MGQVSGSTVFFSHFIFEAESGELFCNGKLVRLPVQSARLLALFLENPKVLLTREDLRSHLWPDGSSVDYDQSINRAVSQLRFILRHTTQRSIKNVEEYIETLPKRGYRFVASIQQNPPAERRKQITEVSLQPIFPLERDSASPEGLGALKEERSSEQVLPAQADSRPHPRGMQTNDSIPYPAVVPRKENRSHLRLFVFSGLLLLVVLISGVVFYSHRAFVAQPLTIGIASFESTGQDSASLAESFRLDLADSLSRIPQMNTFVLKSPVIIGNNLQGAKAGPTEFKLDAVLRGRLAILSNDQCKIDLELVRATDGSHLLSLQYSGKREELASIRDHIEADIFLKMRPSAKSGSLVLKKTSSPAAYNSYLNGRSYLITGTDESLRYSVQAFEKAVGEDPDYARAYAGLASAHYLLSQRSDPGRDMDLEKARRYANKSLALDDSLAEAHEILGEIAMSNDWNFSVAEEQFQRAIYLDPLHAGYHQCLSLLDNLQAKYDLALQEIQRARAVEPERNSFYLTEIYIAVSSRRFALADQVSAELLRKMPDWSLAHEDRGQMLWEAKRYPEAIEEWHQAAILDKNADRARLEEKGAIALRTGGVPAYARLRLDAIASRNGISYEETDFDPAEWYAYEGDKQKSLDAVEALVNRHDGISLELGTNPAYEQFHTDERFLALVKRVGLPIPTETRK